MKHLIFYETFTNKVIIGIDIDGTINDFFNGYNLLYKKYFPDKEIPNAHDWYWYKKLDYNGVENGLMSIKQRFLKFHNLILVP